MNRIFRSVVFYLVLIVAVVWVFNLYRARAEKPQVIPTVNEWVTHVEEHDVSTAKFLTEDEKVEGDFRDGSKYEVFLPHGTIPGYSSLARQYDVAVSADPQAGNVW